jgi:anti-sigma-K factor RskA
MIEDPIADLLPGYAIGALDEDELVQVARHLPTCERCRVELAAFWQTADHLALALPLRSPSPDLRARILSRVEASKPAPAPVPLVKPQPKRPGWREPFDRLFANRLGTLAGGLALAVVLVLAFSNLLMWQRVMELQKAAAPAGNMRLVGLTGTTNAPDAHGYMMVFKSETYGALVVEDAPALNPGYQYQLWLIKDGKRTSGGVFSVDNHGYGTLEVTSALPLEDYPSFGITIEPAGGSPGPTGAKVLGGDL